jgi:hypothetical protein
VNRKQNECSGFSILLVTILRSCLVTCTVRPISNGAESDKVMRLVTRVISYHPACDGSDSKNILFR